MKCIFEICLPLLIICFHSYCWPYILFTSFLQASYSILQSKRLADSLLENNKKLVESDRKLNMRVYELNGEVFYLRREVNSLCNLYKSSESSLAAVNEKLKVEMERYQILESDSSCLVRSGFTMAQEEIIPLYLDLDLSGISVPPVNVVSPIPVAVLSPPRDDVTH